MQYSYSQIRARDSSHASWILTGVIDITIEMAALPRKRYSQMDDEKPAIVVSWREPGAGGEGGTRWRAGGARAAG